MSEQVVLLDHGLYRQLTPEFRQNYTRLWAALVCGNIPEIKKYCTRLNAGEAYPLLSAVLTFKSWDDVMSGDMARLDAKRINMMIVYLDTLFLSFSCAPLIVD